MINEIDWEPVFEQIRIKRRYLELPNTDHATRQEKWFGLVGCGVSKEEADKLCEPKPIDRAQVMKEVAELCAAERRAWNRQNPQPPKPKRRPTLKPGQDPNICYLD
jgi:hypothetical protein